ncbi:MAG: hypothetical protein WCD12_10555 [Candidatus Binatus sp.]|jgi:CRISPR/Cas system-associated protein Csx1|uniref:hypothetical protein n=1 Tax=Candidatus Binatus sp. TaxID=2811406 RepID=UPI003C76D9E8
MRRQKTPQEQREDLERRASALEEERQHLRKLASTEESIFEDAVRDEDIREELAEIRRTQVAIEEATMSRGTIS